MSSKDFARRIFVALCAGVLCLMGGVAQGKIVYVDGAATGNVGAAGTITNPFRHIHTALQDVTTTLSDTIYIAAGTYTSTSLTLSNPRSGQTIIGSWNQAFTETNLTTHPTIWDFQHQWRPFSTGFITTVTIQNMWFKDSEPVNAGSGDKGGFWRMIGSRVTFENCIIEGARTKVELPGPTVRNGGAFQFSGGARATFRDCVIRDCYGTGQGGVFMFSNNGSQLVLERCLLQNNQSGGNGALISSDGSNDQTTMTNCIVVGNHTTTTSTANAGHIISMPGATERMWMFNCTVENNSAPSPTASGGGLFRFANTVANTTFTLTNNIFSNNFGANGQVLFVYTGAFRPGVFQNNLFYLNGTLPLNGVGGAVIGSNGNISGNPIYADPDNGDYQLLAGSPGLDAGLGTGLALTLVPDDYFGTARPLDTGYDIGAIEGVGTAPPPPPNAIRDWTLF